MGARPADASGIWVDRLSDHGDGAAVGLPLGAGRRPDAGKIGGASGSATGSGAPSYRLLRIDPCLTGPAMTCDGTKKGGHLPPLVYVPLPTVFRYSESYLSEIITALGEIVRHGGTLE